MDKIVELSVENFKAVKKADIALNGITVVSGINGCGKSSLSQLLYYSFYYANHFNEIVDSVLNDELLRYVEVLRQIEREVNGLTSVNSIILRHVSVADKNEVFAICRRCLLLAFYLTEILYTVRKMRI